MAKTAAELDRQLINVACCEVVPHVIIAWTAIPLKIARDRRKNASSGERQEPTVRHRVDAVAPGVVRLDLQPMSKSLLGGCLKAVLVAIRTGVQLCNGSESRIGRPTVGKRCKA